jgi:hypothetical protein
MILDRSGQLVTKGDNLSNRMLAVEVAMAVYRGLHSRAEASLDPAIRLMWPDEPDRTRIA